MLAGCNKETAMKATAIYESDDLILKFEADLQEYEEGDEIENITCTYVNILGTEHDFDTIPEALQAAILAEADELEFESTDSSDADDIDD